MPDPSDIFSHISIAPDRASYRDYQDFFSTEAANAFIALAGSSTILDKAAMRMTSDWRGASYLAAMPGTFSMFKSATERAGANLFDSDLHAYSTVETVLGVFCGDIPELVNHPEILRKLRKKAHDGVALARSVVPDVEQIEAKTWQMLMNPKHPVFPLYVWMSQRACLLFVYMAYERFILSLVQHSQNSTILASTKGFNDAARHTLGEHYTYCWDSFDQLKQVRHALAHNSGYVTEKLQVHRKDGLEEVQIFGSNKSPVEGARLLVVDGLIQVHVANNKTLFSELHKRACVAIEHCAADPKFQNATPTGGK